MLVRQILLKKTDLAILKSVVEKLDNDELKKVPTNLSNLKTKVVKLDVDRLVPVLVDLSKLSALVKIKIIGDRIRDITNIATITPLNAKINEAKNKICNITNLGTTTPLTAAENKIPNASNLFKKLTITQNSKLKNKN